MAAVTFTRQALQDLQDIWERYAPLNLNAADRIIDDIAGRCEQLGEFPGQRGLILRMMRACSSSIAGCYSTGREGRGAGGARGQWSDGPFKTRD